MTTEDPEHESADRVSSKLQSLGRRRRSTHTNRRTSLQIGQEMFSTPKQAPAEIIRSMFFTWTVKDTHPLKVTWDFVMMALSIVVYISATFTFAFRGGVRSRGDLIFDYVIEAMFAFDLWMTLHTIDSTIQRASSDTPIDHKALSALQFRKPSFVADAFALMPFEVVPAIFIASSSPVYSLVISLCRLNKVCRCWRLMYSQHLDNMMHITLRVGILLVYFVLLAHMFACALFVFGMMESVQGETEIITSRNIWTGDPWVVSFGLVNEDFMTQYSKSLYFVVVTMATVGYGDISAKTNMEKMFIVAMLMVSAVVYAAIFGRISIHLQVRGKSTAMLQSSLRTIEEYADIYKFPPNLKEKAKSYVLYNWNVSKGFNKKKLFQGVPIEVQLEILLQINEPLIRSVPTFAGCPHEFIRLLVPKLQPLLILKGDYVCYKNDVATEMYFVRKGSVDVIIPNEESGKDNYVAVLYEGSTFGEISVILGERRTATIKARENCELSYISGHDFFEVLQIFPEYLESMKETATRRVKRDIVREEQAKLEASLLSGVIGAVAGVNAVKKNLMANLHAASHVSGSHASRKNIAGDELAKDPGLTGAAVVADDIINRLDALETQSSNISSMMDDVELLLAKLESSLEEKEEAGDDGDAVVEVIS